MSRPKVLVADDSRTIRTIVQRVLMGEGYDVATVTNGQEAIEHALHDCPHLLVLDIQMPVMDGYAVCEQLRRKGEPWSQIPIVFLTNVKSHALELLGMEFGDYVAKPVDADLLLKTVRRFVTPSAASDVAVTPLEKTPPSGPRPTVSLCGENR